MPDHFILFVYYRTPGDARARVRALLDAHLDGIGRAFDLPATGGLKTESRAGGALTWLEVYAPVDSATLSALERDIASSAQRLGLTALATEGRHLEVFQMFGAAR